MPTNRPGFESARDAARSIGNEVGQELTVPFYTAAEWKKRKQPAVLKLERVHNKTFPAFSWWWFAPTALAIAVISLLLANSPAGALTCFLLGIAFVIHASLRQRREEQTRLAERHALLALFEGAVAEAYNARLEAARNAERLEQEKRETAQAQALAKKIGERKKLREEAIASGIPRALTEPPGRQFSRLTPEGAEHYVAQWMRAMGALDAEVTQFSNDGGIDVVSHAHVAQVKHYKGTVGVASIRELGGASAADGRAPLFFTSGRYTDSAIHFADVANIALFRYDELIGTLVPVNDVADSYLKFGL